MKGGGEEGKGREGRGEREGAGKVADGREGSPTSSILL